MTGVESTRPAVMLQVQMGGAQPRLFFASMFLSRNAVPASVTAPAPGWVLDARRVAGYDAVVLEADSPGALTDWLKAHGYAERAGLSAWLAP